MQGQQSYVKTARVVFQDVRGRYNGIIRKIISVDLCKGGICCRLGMLEVQNKVDNVNHVKIKPLCVEMPRNRAPSTRMSINQTTSGLVLFEDNMCLCMLHENGSSSGMKSSCLSIVMHSKSDVDAGSSNRPSSLQNLTSDEAGHL
ncbi:hypothetical protein Tco_0421755 [Tanacetum coccineum]